MDSPVYTSSTKTETAHSKPFGAPLGNSNAQIHGLRRLQDGLRKLGNRGIDGQS
jgi:hypothetical protein